MEPYNTYVFVELDPSDVGRWRSLETGGWKREGPDSLLPRPTGRLEIPDARLVPLEVFVALDHGEPVERLYLMRGPSERKVGVREYRGGAVLLRVTNHVYAGGGMEIDPNLTDRLLLALPKLP